MHIMFLFEQTNIKSEQKHKRRLTRTSSREALTCVVPWGGKCPKNGLIFNLVLSDNTVLQLSGKGTSIFVYAQRDINQYNGRDNRTVQYFNFRFSPEIHSETSLRSLSFFLSHSMCAWIYISFIINNNNNITKKYRKFGSCSDNFSSTAPRISTINIFCYVCMRSIYSYAGIISLRLLWL